MLLIIGAYNKWMESPILFGFAQTTTKIHEILFPTITICPEKKMWDIQKAWTPEDMQNHFHPMDWTAFETHSQICPKLCSKF
jgi:hypothetical protein